jgi:hypothetical protein
MQGDMMVKDKKMAALKELIKQMFEFEASGEKDTAVDLEQQLHEAVETPEEEKLEHVGGITEEEENASEPEGEDMKETMQKFFKMSNKSPVKGKSKKIIARMDFAKPKEKKTLA